MKRALITGLAALAFWGFLPLWAWGADVTLFWQCASVNASGVTVTGQCPVGTTYPLPVAGGGGGAITGPLGSSSTDAQSVAVTTGGTDTSGVSVLGTGLKGYLGTLIASVDQAIAAGTNIIGKVGIDQTTPGTSNGVALVGVNGATALAGAGAVGTGAPRVAVGQDTSTVAGSPPDPCQANAKTNVPIATSSASTELVVLAVGKKTYICSFAIMSAGAAVINIVEGTGSGVCTGGTPVADLGSTTAANGLSLAANGGLTYGNGGSTVIGGTTAAYNVCLVQSGTAALAGNLTYVQQ